MSINANTLSVLPNPYCFLDVDGEPQGVYPDEPDVSAGSRMFVGASLDHDRTKLLENWRQDDVRRLNGVSPPQTTKFCFDAEPVKRPKTKHYQDGLRTGGIIAADEQSAKFAGIDFLPPAEALDRERLRAIAKWRANYGADPPFAHEPEAEAEGAAE